MRDKARKIHDNKDRKYLHVAYLAGKHIGWDIFFRKVGAKVIYFRTSKGLTQEQLADQAHVSQATLSRVENGKYNANLSLALLIDIADGLDINPIYLFDFLPEERGTWMES